MPFSFLLEPTTAGLKTSTIETYNQLNKEFQQFLFSKEVEGDISDHFESQKEELIFEYFSLQSRRYTTNACWKYYSALRKLLLQQCQVDLKTLPVYRLICNLLVDKGRGERRNQEGYGTALDEETIANALNYYPEEDGGLVRKAIFVVGVFGCFRSDDLKKIKFTDLKIKRFNKTIHINIQPRDSKGAPISRGENTSHYDQQSPKTSQSTACITHHPSYFNNSPYNIFLRYLDSISESTKTIPDHRYIEDWKKIQVFRNYDKRNKAYNKPMGINYIKKVTRQVLEYLCSQNKLSDAIREAIKNPGMDGFMKKLSGHSMRKTMGTIAQMIPELTETEKKRIGNWSSTSTLNNYYVNSDYSDEVITSPIFSTREMLKPWRKRKVNSEKEKLINPQVLIQDPPPQYFPIAVFRIAHFILTHHTNKTPF
jgi:hypothetical protein